MQVEIRFQPSGRTVRVPRGTTLLEAARAAGLPAARACGGDLLCGRCACTVLRGDTRTPSDRERTTMERNRVDAGKRLACAIELETDACVTAPSW